MQAIYAIKKLLTMHCRYYNTQAANQLLEQAIAFSWEGLAEVPILMTLI